MCAETKRFSLVVGYNLISVLTTFDHTYFPVTSYGCHGTCCENLLYWRRICWGSYDGKHCRTVAITLQFNNFFGATTSDACFLQFMSVTTNLPYMLFPYCTLSLWLSKAVIAAHCPEVKVRY